MRENYKKICKMTFNYHQVSPKGRQGRGLPQPQDIFRAIPNTKFELKRLKLVKEG